MSGGVTSVGSGLMQVIDDKWLPRRYAVLAVAGAIFAWVWLNASGVTRGADWSGFLDASRSFTTAPSHGDVVAPFMLVIVYPFTYLSVATSWHIVCVLCTALGLLTIWCIEQTAEFAGLGSRLVRERAVLFGGLVLMYAWALPSARWGHFDDVIALTAIAVAIRAVVRERWLVAAIAIGVAIDAKLWAAMVLPLAAVHSGKRVRGLAVAVLLAGLPWVPFYFAQHGHLASLNLPVMADSDLRILGVATGATPGWARALQLAVALPLGAYAVAKDRWYLVPAIAFAVRLNLDPVTVPYYTTSAVLGLFVWDVMQPSRIPGGRTAVGCVGLTLVPSFLWGLNGYGAAGPFVIALRLAVAVIPIAALFGLAARSVRPAPESLPSAP